MSTKINTLASLGFITASALALCSTSGCLEEKNECLGRDTRNSVASILNTGDQPRASEVCIISKSRTIKLSNQAREAELDAEAAPFKPIAEDFINKLLDNDAALHSEFSLEDIVHTVNNPTNSEFLTEKVRAVSRSNEARQRFLDKALATVKQEDVKKPNFMEGATRNDHNDLNMRNIFAIVEVSGELYQADTEEPLPIYWRLILDSNNQVIAYYLFRSDNLS